MNILLNAIVLGVSFAPFIFQKLDMWEAQGFWAQGLILLGFTYSFFEKPRNKYLKNKPLSMFMIYVTMSFLLAIYGGYITSLHGKVYSIFAQTEFNVSEFKPIIQIVKAIFVQVNIAAQYLNMLTMLLFYTLVTKYLSRRKIETILWRLRYVYIGTLLLCTLQYFGLSQFFNLIDPMKFTGQAHHYNAVVGFSGNGTHLSGFLASLSPLLFIKFNREDKLALGLLVLVLLKAGMMVGDPAISGFIVLIVSVWWIFKSKYNTIILGILAIICLTLVNKTDFFSFTGRQQIFIEYIKFFKKMPILGCGLGFVNSVFVRTQVPTARHLHLEYFQVAVEMGLIGLVLFINIIRDFISKVAEDRTELVLKAGVVGFLVSCLFNYPAHLWLPSTIAMFFYASFYTINKRICNEHINKKRD